MLPKKDCEKLSCLQKLVAVRADCSTNNCADYYIEDIEGLDIRKLAQLSGPQQPSGLDVAKDLIRTAANEMLGDIELLINDGFTLKDTMGDLCSSCDFITLYQPGGGILVTNAISSQYSILRILKVDILTNYTGSAILNFDDGQLVTQYTVILNAGVIAPIVFNYSTTQPSVKIYFENASIATAQIQCLTNKSCGCGGAKNSDALDTVRYSGLLAGSASAIQYGFKVCANISCSSDILVCSLIQQTPRIFGLTLLYKVGQKAYSVSTLQTDRITPFTAANGDERKLDMKLYYEGLYKQRLNGKNGGKGVASIINQFLRQRTDRCVTCEGATSKTGWVVG